MTTGSNRAIAILSGEQLQLVLKSIVERRLDRIVAKAAKVQLVFNDASRHHGTHLRNKYDLRFRTYAPAAHAHQAVARFNGWHQVKLGVATFNEYLGAWLFGIQVLHQPDSVGGFQRDGRADGHRHIAGVSHADG